MAKGLWTYETNEMRVEEKKTKAGIVEGIVAIFARNYKSYSQTLIVV